MKNKKELLIPILVIFLATVVIAMLVNFKNATTALVAIVVSVAVASSLSDNAWMLYLVVLMGENAIFTIYQIWIGEGTATVATVAVLIISAVLIVINCINLFQNTKRKRLQSVADTADAKDIAEA